MLHNPRYAGAFAYGRSRQLSSLTGASRTSVFHAKTGSHCTRQACWLYLLGPLRGQPGKAVGKRAGARLGAAPGPAAGGPGLAAGPRGVRCLRRPHDGPVPHTARPSGSGYLCQREGITHAGAICQRIPGAGIDRAVGALLVERMTPVTLEVALRVQAELAQRADEAEAWRSRQVQRARQEADLARQRYRQVDPGNRLVADVPEWNACLRELEDAQRGMRAQARRRPPSARRGPAPADPGARDRLPAPVERPATPDRERKRMARLLIEDVTRPRGRASPWAYGCAAAPRSCWPYRSSRAPATATAPRPGSSLKSTRCSKTTPSRGRQDPQRSRPPPAERRGLQRGTRAARPEDLWPQAPLRAAACAWAAGPQGDGGNDLGSRPRRSRNGATESC